jgi:shikimate dehydrogenase
MHNAAFAKLGLPHRYETKDVADGELSATLDRMRRGDVLGANVTIPHKEAALKLVDEVSAEARRIGAVNTILVRGGRLIGDNTDGIGFRRAVAERSLFAESETVLVLGAGGAARAVVRELLRSNDVIVAARTMERAEALVTAVRPDDGANASAIAWTEAQHLEWVDGLVNATPLGLEGEDALAGFRLKSLPRSVADLVPIAAETPLVRRAREAQHVRFMDGLLMLLHQAARSFELWTGVPAPLEAMRAALPRPA